MFRVVLSRCLFLIGIIFYLQCSWAAASRYTGLKLKTSVAKSRSSLVSGDSVTFTINVKHVVTSRAKAVDIVLRIELPIYLRFNNYDSGRGISPSSFENKSSSIFTFKFNEIKLVKQIDMSLVTDVDPYFIDGRRQTIYLSAVLDFWYYGEDGPCARPASYFNARHENELLSVNFFATQACEQPLHTTLGLSNHHYFASSISSAGEAYRASLSNAGAWVPANSYSSDRNQFIEINFKRLVKVTKIATRGMTNPFLAFVRSYHLYHSKNLIEWSGYREKHQLKLFTGNSDGTHFVFTYIPLPITAKYVRIVPRTWKLRQAMELEVYGCPAHPLPKLSDFCPLFDFESSLDGWKKTGEAFNNQPTLGDNLLSRTGQSANIQGQGWVATAENRMRSYMFPGGTQGDDPIGTTTSPKFLVAASKLYFLIGGTADAAKARAELLVDDIVVRTASGVNETMTEQEWNVREFLGKEARLRLVDAATDGHINFDAFRIDCHLDGDAENITLPSRSVLLNPSTHSFYVCDSTHMRYKGNTRCRMTNNMGNWFDIPDVLGLLGVDTSSSQLYAVSNDKHVLVSLTTTGQNWRYIKRYEWDEIKQKPTMLFVMEVNRISAMDGAVSETLVQLQDNNGEKWRATSFGTSFKGVGKDWIPIASWYCQVSDISNDPCISEPCQHSAKCENPSPKQYRCICVPGYTGVDCEQDIDDCVGHDCLNGASCLDGKNMFACLCKYGYAGKKCEIELSACRNSPCLNGGTCVDLGSGNFKCNCLSDYRGSYCQIVNDPCERSSCVNGATCILEGGNAQCVCRRGFYGTTCSGVRHSNFDVLSTATVQETNSYLVIKAKIPSDGRSLAETWCRDYDKLCESYSGRRATGLGASYQPLSEHASCQENYFSVMDSTDVLGGTPNEKVAELAQRAGFSTATSSNSFAFKSCSHCSDTLPETGCDESLSCINKAVPSSEVFTVCIDPDTNFGVRWKLWTQYSGVRLLVLAVKPTGYYSKSETWCRDYQKLCTSFGLRPIGSRDSCRAEYNSITHSGITYSKIRDIARHSYSTNYAFIFQDCGYCSNDVRDNYNALSYMRYYYYSFKTACAHPNGIGFKVLTQKTINYNGADYLVIKAQIALSGRANGSNWCNDYQLLCQSYGKQPVGCGSCRVKYKSKKSNYLGCPVSTDKIKVVANAAGFSEATTTNCFGLNDCNACSKTISDSECREEDLICLKQDNVHRIVYTVCIEAAPGALDAIETRSTIYKSTPYLVIKTKFPSNGEYRLKNWCEEYQVLCENYGGKPTGCGATHVGDPLYSSCRDTYGSIMDNDNLGCGNSSTVYDVVTAVGFSGAYSYNTFAFNKCSTTDCTTSVTYNCQANCTCHPSLSCVGTQVDSSNRYAYAVCVSADSAFEVLDIIETTYKDDDVLVVKARLPVSGVAKHEDWCEDYRRLCLSYWRRPTGCGKSYSNQMEYITCRSRYQSVMPEGDDYDCPPNNAVSTIAKSVGFTSANSANSFAFTKCTSACVKILTAGNSFIDITVPDREVYTICSSSNSNFKVVSNQHTTFNGGQYLFVEAKVPSDFKSRHADWCTDYERMCGSYGLLPVGRHSSEGVFGFSSCIKKYHAVNTMRIEATLKGEVIFLGPLLGYSRAGHYNTFTLKQNCHKGCHSDMTLFYSESSPALYYLREYSIREANYQVYTVCASSDSNFYVLSTRSLVHNGQNYLVIMASLPSHGESKYESWCKDYERLCRTFKMRPTGCGKSYQWSSKYRSCVEQFQSAMVDNSPVGCNSSENVASLANQAGFPLAHPNNSFVFHQCSGDGSCPRKLTGNCPESLPCLTSKSDIVYTVCTDSASAFIVENVQDSRDRGLPLLLIGTSFPTVVKPQNKNWCIDYQKLCESFAARPVSCGSETKFGHRWCSPDYNAVGLIEDVQRCKDDGVSDIHRLENVARDLTEGQYFKFQRCSEQKCEKQMTEQCHESLYCLKDTTEQFLYTVCSRSSNNFEVLKRKSLSHGEFDDILVIKARVPSNGRSLYDTWCDDYEKVCSVYGKRPLACPSRTDYLGESRYRSCRDKYNGYMMSNSSFTCPLNDFVATISKLAHYSHVSAENSFALSTCSSCSNTLKLVVQSNSSFLSADSICPPNSVCSEWPLNVSAQVYLLCVKPRAVSSFVVEERRQVRHEGRKFIVFRLTAPADGVSGIGNWCSDYQKLCESVSMRPITCGSKHTHVKKHRDCRLNYNAIMPRDFSCSPKTDIDRVVKAAGFNGDSSNTFGLYDCMDCSAILLGYGGLNNIGNTDRYLYTACTNSDSGFNVIQKRSVVVAGTSFVVLKAQLPVHMLSSHENWCKDYQMMCESYGKRPLSCPGVSMCQSSFNALAVDSVKCGDDDNLDYIPQSAGFTEANKDNTFVLHSCEVNKCKPRIPAAASNGALGAINSTVENLEVYTMCISSTTAYDVIATKQYKPSSANYLLVRVKLPSHATSRFFSWCHDYQQLCSEYGYRPLACYNGRCVDFRNAVYLTQHACPVTTGISNIASNAGMDHVTDETNFAYSSDCFSNVCKKVAATRNCTTKGKYPMNCYDNSLNSGEFTTVCVTVTDTQFPALDARKVTYSGRKYLVVRTQKLAKSSVQSNWCYDYRNLCLSFRMWPLACAAKYSGNPSYHYCNRKYSAVSMENVDHGCPLNEFVADLAKLAGFTTATPMNSFAFHNCSGLHCTKVVRQEECHEALYCMNTIGNHGDLYTACTGSDSAFQVIHYKTGVSYSSIVYDVFKVSIYENQVSLHEDWCHDYRRLCQSMYRIPVQCYDSSQQTDVCTDSYGAYIKIPCGNTAKNIAVKAGYPAKAENTFVMHKCSACPRKIAKTCSGSSLKCARSGYMYTICAKQPAMPGNNLAPLQTRSLTYGYRRYLVVQTHLVDYRSFNWKNDYINLCGFFGYIPIGCGKTASDGSSYVRDCLSYTILSSKGDDFSCPASRTIAVLARQAGFYAANGMNSFAFYECGRNVYSSSYSGITLSSSSCFSRVHCLQRSSHMGILHTMCAKPTPPQVGFDVLDKKPVTFLNTKYLALKLKINLDGISSSDSWCQDYRDLCRAFNMVPTGCGSKQENSAPYSMCKTKYNSFMSYRNALKCRSASVPSAIVRRAGFPEANTANTFVFNRCDGCVKTLKPLTADCDSALYCLYSSVWEKQAYTLCVERRHGFEVLSKKKTSYDNTDYVVIEAALPSDNRALLDNWCQDYQKLCYSFGQFPVACSINGNTPDVRKFAETYGAVTVDGISCPPAAKVVNIVKSAGYSKANTANSFVLTGHSGSACSNYVSSWRCASGLDCLKSKSRVVYTLCTNPTNFEVSDIKRARHANNIFSVLQLRLPKDGLAKAATWCDDYVNLCRALKQQPVACQSSASLRDYETCRVKYDAYLLSDNYNCSKSHSSLKELALIAGFSNASIINTFGLMSCTSTACQKQIYAGPKCDPSLNCVNGKAPNRQVFALCIKVKHQSNFQVQETKQIYVSNVLYLAIRAVIPMDGKSKRETWCKDYERMCLAQNMRPVRCFSEQDHDCLGQYNALIASPGQLDCDDNTKLVQLLKKAGYTNSSLANSFIYGACASSKLCHKRLQSSQCDSSLNCLQQPSSGQNLMAYTVCARSLSTSFIYREARSTVYDGVQYLVIKTTLTSGRVSTNKDWCYDYRDMCASFGKRPVVHGRLSSSTASSRVACFTIYNGTTTQQITSGLGYFAQSAGFDSGACVINLQDCRKCFNTLKNCPFNACHCENFYLLCI